ncbi:DUF7504 family protein [Haloglomus halophilum]|uniref:DUF7504 family protein n=1 Tax=Haloglomus halophilum TaxID=2962672 RepID=UPI0020C9F488|nr:hypothetical protein [Haloglomus halophilum]
MRWETAELDRLRDVPNTLILGPSVDESVNEAGRRLLRGEADTPTHALVVTFVKGPDSWVEDWRRTVGDLPEDLVIVTTTDGFGGSDVGDGTASSQGVTTEYVSSPGDLTGLGMIIGKYLERWYQDEGDIRVVFDSLTTILQYGEPQNVYRFLHLMTTRFDGADASAYFLFDPETQDPQTVATIKSSFQAIAQFEGDGEWEVNQR